MALTTGRMVVLGISGRERDAASAIMIDGTVVAAMTEESCVRTPRAGYEHTGGFPFASAKACLEAAGVSADRIDRIVLCERDAGDAAGDMTRLAWRTKVRRRGGWASVLSGVPADSVGRLHAHAFQVCAIPQFAGPILVLDGDGRGHGAVFSRVGESVTLLRPIEHFNRLVHFAQRAAAALGLDGDAIDALEAEGVDGSPVYVPSLRRGLWYVAGGGVERDARALGGAFAEANADASGRLAERQPLHVAVGAARANFAASVMSLVCEIACEIAEDVAESAEHGTIGVSGSLFAHHGIIGPLRASLGDRARVAPVPGAVGLALGAVMSAAGGAQVSLPAGLAIGQVFSESQVKEALDGAHLDYVYEPAWPRIMARVTRLLTGGKLVGWFQGPIEFGTGTLGARSVL